MTTWQDHAVCALYGDPEPWDQTDPRDPLTHTAVQLCRTCPVQQLCHSWVDPTANHYDGVVAGRVYRAGRPVPLRPLPKPYRTDRTLLAEPVPCPRCGHPRHVEHPCRTCDLYTKHQQGL